MKSRNLYQKIPLLFCQNLPIQFFIKMYTETVSTSSFFTSMSMVNKLNPRIISTVPYFAMSKCITVCATNNKRQYTGALVYSCI